MIVNESVREIVNQTEEPTAGYRLHRFIVIISCLTSQSLFPQITCKQ
uniref:Uncharacterized protein n=1 Tax=Anguilla anguilla TaxID=7936 RepID=A0A0E9QSU2_ANGAN